MQKIATVFFLQLVDYLSGFVSFVLLTQGNGIVLYSHKEFCNLTIK